MRFRWLSLLVISGLLAALTANLSAQETDDPVLLDVPIGCEAAPEPPGGTSISYNISPTLDSPFADVMHSQATNYVRQGTFYAAQRQYLIAERYLTYAIDRLNYLYNQFSAQAFTATRDGNTTEAINNYVRAYAISVNLADVHDRRGLMRIAQQDYAGAVGDVTEALAFVPSLHINPAYATAYYEVGNDHEEQGEFTEAIDLYSRALALNPIYEEAYHKRGGLYDSLGNHFAAVVDFTCAAEFNPYYAPNYHLRGRAFAALGQYEQAIDDYTHALQLDTRNSLAYIDRGIVYREIGQYSRAITDFTWAAIANPTQPAAYNNRAVTYERLGLYSQALTDFNHAILLDPFNPAYYNNRAWVLRQLNNAPASNLDFARAAMNVNYTVPRLLIEGIGAIINLNEPVG
jgi:tetratricopeptide (TPR) repeat protein